MSRPAQRVNRPVCEPPFSEESPYVPKADANDNTFRAALHGRPFTNIGASFVINATGALTPHTPIVPDD